MPRKNTTDKFRRLAKAALSSLYGKIWLVQSGTDTEPLDTTRRYSPRFFPYMGGPGLDAGRGYKTSPHPSYLSRLPLSPRSPTPGSSARERPPHKGLHQRSLEVARSWRLLTIRSSYLNLQRLEGV